MIAIIISASRRTDIPAFYSEWFINRIRAGYFIKVNPYNSKQQKVVSLLPAEVEAIIFWTKNPLPIIKYLSILNGKGYRYLFHYTLNNYPVVFEPQVSALANRIDIFKRLSEQIGPAKVIWRYDPLIISNITPVDYHLEQFNKIAGMLHGYTERVMISFLTFYDKVQIKFKKLEREAVLQIMDIRDEMQRDTLISLAQGMGRIAEINHLQIYSCAEKIDLTSCRIQHGSCIDLGLINRVFNLNLRTKKDKYQRGECRCAESLDMGFYDTCKFDCSYCYANTNSKAVLNNRGRYNPESPMLLGC